MDEIKDLCKHLKCELDNLPLFIEFKRVETLYLNNEELKSLKKEIVRAKNENRIEDHKRLLKQFNDNPLVQNYLSLKDDVAAYLKEVSMIINENL